MISIIAAVGNQGQIGLNGKLPWSLKDDLENFKKLTTNNVIIMGRKTFESVGKPLPNKINVIITRQKDYKVDGAFVFSSLAEALETYKDSNIFICGGEQIYRESLKYKIDRLYITHVDYNGKADAFFPEIDLDKWELMNEKYCKKDDKNEYDCVFRVYKRN